MFTCNDGMWFKGCFRVQYNCGHLPVSNSSESCFVIGTIYFFNTENDTTIIDTTNPQQVCLMQPPVTTTNLGELNILYKDIAWHGLSNMN